MNRSLKLSILTALALASSQALAIDLGQIQVKSALDRPLVAEIPVHPDYPGEADHLKVTLAPADAFTRAGISRANLKVPLAFKVVTRSDGEKVIRVTSSQPVREPYLDFLIQVSWPKGKMLREYTVLLDPLSARTSMPMSSSGQAASQNTTRQTSSTPTRSATDATVGKSGSEPSASRSSTYGPVQHGDTLSHIAMSHAIDGISYQQMLVALKAANPDAFFKDNVNALKSGAVLRIPTRQQALSVTRKAAIAAVREQNQSWQSRNAAPTMVATSGGSSAPVTGTGGGDKGGDRLSLVPPADDNDGSSAGAANGGDASASELRQQLARKQEALSSQKQAASDLQSRVAALEQLQDKNKRLLSLKNAEIAELQDKLADARKAAGLPALPASTLQAQAAAATSSGNIATAASATTATTAAVAPATTGTVAANSASVAASTSVAATAAATPAEPDADTNADQPGSQPASSPATTPNTAATPWYEQLWARVVLIVIIVLLIAWAFLRRRKPRAARERGSVADHFAGPSTHADADEVDEQHADDDAEPMTDDDGEHELLAQLAEHPDNVGLHLELVSLYYARRDVDRFEASAEAMHAYVDDETRAEWQEVLAMGRELAPDHPLFGAPVTPEVDEPTDLDHPTDVDHDMDHSFDEHGGQGDSAPDADGHEVADDAGETQSNGYSFDFDLVPEPTDSGDDVSLSEPPAETPVNGLPDESEFDALPPLPPESGTQPPREDEAFEVPDSPDAREDEFADTLATDDAADDFAHEGFSDDPVDTKLDLARAYIDMGDHDGARAMLHEAIHEGSQMQKDTAQKLLDDLG